MVMTTNVFNISYCRIIEMNAFASIKRGKTMTISYIFIERYLQEFLLKDPKLYKLSGHVFIPS